jgi:CHAD domain-containing protein
VTKQVTPAPSATGQPRREFLMAHQREIERKFSADPGVPLPDLPGVGRVVTVTDPVKADLEATYFDTADLRLAAHGITLRRRTGGEDPGWHLKLPAGADERTEIQRPLGGAPRTVPRELMREILAVVRDRELVPVATVWTTRLVRRLLDAGGNDLAVVADDTVHAERLAGGPAEPSTWREVEVELTGGDRALLDAVSARLEAAGLSRSAAASKLQRVLGDLASPRQAGRPALSRCSRAGDAVLAYWRDQVEALVSWDRGVRGDVPDAVHQMRVATRRLRSTLATHRPLLDRQRTDPVRDELKWLGSMLGNARDAEVLHVRLRDLAAAQSPELILGPVLRRIDLEMDERHRAARNCLVEALGGKRYFRLLDALDDLATDPPFAARARQRGDRVLPRLVARACRRLDRTAKAAGDAATPEDRDHLLHEVRKAAKNARYAAESVAPVCGRPAARLAKRMQAVQDVLGENQDSVAARQVLREIGVVAHQAGENAFTFGLLYGLERSRGEAAQHAYQPALRAASRKGVRRWMQ